MADSSSIHSAYDLPIFMFLRTFCCFGIITSYWYVVVVVYRSILVSYGHDDSDMVYNVVYIITMAVWGCMDVVSLCLYVFIYRYVGIYNIVAFGTVRNISVYPFIYNNK